MRRRRLEHFVSVPEIFSVQLLSLGYSLQSINLRPVCALVAVAIVVASLFDFAPRIISHGLNVWKKPLVTASRFLTEIAEVDFSLWSGSSTDRTK
jgi:hypothetical protein